MYTENLSAYQHEEIIKNKQTKKTALEQKNQT